jgi:valyl-tRNA synthetase
VAVKQEHMYMRTRKITCPSCKKAFRPGGPWPSDDAELPTAKQASERFEAGRNFANKLWNAARFILLNLEGYTPGAIRLDELAIEDRWILSRLATTAAAVTDSLQIYRFAEALRAIYDFTWSEFCDWYVEMSKGRLQRGAPSDESRLTAQRVLIGVLDCILRLVQPIMPFVAESIWQTLGEVAFERGLPAPDPVTESVIIAPWPSLPDAWRDASMETRIGRMQDLVGAVREVRNRYMIDAKTRLDVFVRTSNAVAADFEQLRPFIVLLAGVGRLQAGADVAKPPLSASSVHDAFEAYVPLAGLIDVGAEVKRLEKQLVEKRKHLQAIEAKLGNASFADKAPKDVVQQQRDQAAELQSQIAVMEDNSRDLQKGTA